jgi:ParB family chromosome partitioning protein
MIDPDVLRLQERLSEKLGAKIAINHHSDGKGKMVINYTSLDELDGILKRIN